MKKYRNLRRKLQKIWNMRLKIMSLVVGSLDAIPKHFGNRLKETSITPEIVKVQMIVLLGTARILRKAL